VLGGNGKTPRYKTFLEKLIAAEIVKDRDRPHLY
jgi:hypothetical protein